MSLLEVDKLSIRYDDNTVVDNVSFTVGVGESVGIVGESGSGKSQTAMAALGLLTNNAVVTGSVKFDGVELLNKRAKILDRIRARRIAVVFQDPMSALNPYLRVGRQLREILLRHRGVAARAADALVLTMLERVGLPDAAEQARAYPHQLSGGMRQRVMIAAALICEPDLLIADEPTTALDVTVQAQILDLLEALRDSTALLLITHDLGVIAGRCERLLVFEDGRLIESGATTSIFAAPETEHTRRLIAAAPRIDKPVPQLAPASEQTILTIDDASVRYQIGKQRLDAVVDVSLSLRRGETLAIVGESGSGKSSLIRAMLGLIPQHAGRVIYAGEPLAGLVQQRAASQRRDLQLVFQDPMGALNPQMRVQTLIEEPLVVHNRALSRAERTERVIAILKKVGLDASYLARYPHQLSGGQAQRVAIARALILEPKVLICDEAVAALDGSVRKQVLALLQALQLETELAIIFVSHDLGVVRSISHRVAVMYLGRLVEVADSVALFESPKHPYTQALLLASPIPDPLIPPSAAPLGGEIPSPRFPPTGCVFHPRCTFADDACRSSRPELRNQDNARVACHHAEDISFRNALS